MRTHIWATCSVVYSTVGFDLGVCASVHCCCAVQDRMANCEEGNQAEEAHTQAEAVLTQMIEFMTGLREFKEKISGQKEELVRLAVKRARQERPHAFRRPGNAAQYMFVEEVLEHVRDAAWQIEKVEGTRVTAALKGLKEGEALLAHRLRLIKIADRSEHGWNMIAAYENDELALDSDDEKRLSRAEKEAAKRATKRKPRCTTPDAAPVPLMGDLAQQTRRHGAARIGPCYSCGEIGHLSRYCPKSAAGRIAVPGPSV